MRKGQFDLSTSVLRDVRWGTDHLGTAYEGGHPPPNVSFETEQQIRFGDALQNHLDEERKHFYRRVAMCVQDDPAKSAFVERSSAHMDGIARQVIIFTKHYKSIGVNRMNNDEFRHDLEVIATLLGDRIDLEETSLYALYLPPQHAGQPPQADESLRVLEYAKR